MNDQSRQIDAANEINAVASGRTATMMNRPDTNDLQSILAEAAHRIRFANQMIEHIEDREGKGCGGFEFAVIREVLDDVAGTLKAAADRPELV